VNETVTAPASKWRRRLRTFAYLLAACALLLVAVRLWPHPPLADRGMSSVAVVDRHGKLLRLTLAADERYRLWTPLQEISPVLVQGVLLHEDAWFYWHPGVNALSVARGAWSTYGSGEARIGGSTITMQYARLRWQLDTHHPYGKLVQIARALQLEACYSKHEILEAYLNAAPYGGNIEGVGAASRIYFRKDASELTLPEALTLAVLPQAPSRRGRLSADDSGASYLGAGLSAARGRLYARWRARHPPDAARDAQMALPLRLHATRELPFRAPHLVERVLADRALHPDPGPRLQTTLDLRMQSIAEERVRSYLRRTRQRGLDNAAVLVIDTRDMGVRALVGSADYFDPHIHGQVNASVAKRSPGSTLKPFIYALALDQGVLHPATVLRDVPTAFGPYTPENFDGRFLGPVTAQEALVRSRNIPAVTVASQLTSPSFYEFLKQAGVSHMASERHYGLALVLGGGETSMEELARMYAMLGNDGRLRSLRWRHDDPGELGAELLSPEASFITRDMLRQHPRPGFEFGAQSADRMQIAWKTGTSWGFRDAWTAGLVGPYAIVVWMGNFDGSGNPALVGVDAAAPLFFELADGFRAGGISLAEPQRQWPLNLRQVEICRASGDLPNAWCPERGLTWFIPGKSPIRVSRVHRAVPVDIATGHVACGPFDPATMRMQVYEYWPSDLAHVFAQAGIPRRRPPPDDACTEGQSWMGSAPMITSPFRATTYTMRLSHPEQAQLTLTATTDADVSKVFWFAGDSFVGSAKAGYALAWQPPRPGHYRLSVVDDHGRHDAREVEIGVEQ
jgi:penicillin-binding protein 1C